MVRQTMSRIEWAESGWELVAPRATPQVTELCNGLHLNAAESYSPRTSPMEYSHTMLIHPLDRIRKLVSRINELEDKLMKASFMPLAEQKKLHDEIHKFKEEIAVLERQTRK